ncbi:MAG: bifunctional UDP-N-acetylglucosamine diphosphorylase/glucosamine-1-phosphate N-acetyltransferase GlmU [Nitrospira sp.]
MTDQTGTKAVPGLGVVVMAAGQGTRMRSNQAKVLHRIAGRPMVLYALDLARRMAGHSVAVVVGHQAEQVRAVLQPAIAGAANVVPVHIVEQRQQLGTGHAVLQTREVFTEKPAPSAYLILNGDTPLLQDTTVRELLRVHQSSGATVTMLTAALADPTGYGRVVRRQGAGESADVIKIVEHRDASPDERAIHEINVGTYVVDGAFLFAALEKVQPHNAQGEYYLTDIVDMAVRQGHRVSALQLTNPDEGLGVNTRGQLAEAEQVIRQAIRRRWMDAGVTMIDPASTWIESDVTIGKDTVLHPNVTLEGTTRIGEGCELRSFTRLTNCEVGDQVTVLDHCVFAESRIEERATLGPFVHLRPGVLVRKKAKVGNFVEMKKTELGEGSKANHLTYLGDATIGKGVNIGAGTITCNYDGAHKYKTVIGDNVFLGSDTQLIAPVTIGPGAVIAAGTTVTEDVPADALTIARVTQVNRAGWAAKRRALLSKAEQPPAQTPRATKRPARAANKKKRR